MMSFPENQALTLWRGLALFLLIEALFIMRLVARLWANPNRRDDPRGSQQD